MVFWEPWQLWVKMTFVLACAIVIVVGAGGCKLIWMHRNLRKHVKILQERQAEQKALMARPSVRERRRKTEVPFGVRAIESGIEVEGVWISRPNSAATSRVASPALSDTTSPASPTDYLRAETPVSGAARVLAAKTRPLASRATSDPFRDSRAVTVESLSSRGGREPDSASSGSTTYHDLPDAESGFANVRMPSNQSLHSSSKRKSSGSIGVPSQPAFYRPTGTPDPHRRRRASYIPKHLQSRAMGPDPYEIDEATYKNSPTDDEGETPTSYAFAGTSRTEGAHLLSRAPQSEPMFIAPAGMMPQIAGHPTGWTPSGRMQQHQQPYRDETSPETDVEPEYAAPSFQSFVENDPRRPVKRSSRMPSQEEQLVHLQEQRSRTQHPSGQPESASSQSGGAKAATPLSAQQIRQQHHIQLQMQQQQQIRQLQQQRQSQQQQEPPSSSFASRSDAEAARSDMRRVNDGFSVSRHGMRRNRESLIAEAQGLRDEREQQRKDRDRTTTSAGAGGGGGGSSSRGDAARSSFPSQQQQQQQQESAFPSNDKDGRRRLQKKRASVALAPAEELQQHQQQQPRQQRAAAAAPMSTGSTQPPSSSSNGKSSRKSGRISSQFREQM